MPRGGIISVCPIRFERGWQISVISPLASIAWLAEEQTPVNNHFEGTQKQWRTNVACLRVSLINMTVVLKEMLSHCHTMLSKFVTHCRLLSLATNQKRMKGSHLYNMPQLLWYFLQIAVEGCCHGELDAIYRHLQQLEERHAYKIDLLLICGDFQAVRNYQDLQCMAVPNKYKRIQNFHRYYTGERSAPVLTIVIGGNHEASNYMSELWALIPIWRVEGWPPKVSWWMVGSKYLLLRVCRVCISEWDADYWGIRNFQFSSLFFRWTVSCLQSW